MAHDLRNEQIPARIAPGDFYEDCFYHPVLCTYVSEEDDEIAGISLVDGSAPRSCSIKHCGVRRLAFEEAVETRKTGGRWSKCSYCGHQQAWHRDLVAGGCDHPDDCDCSQPWSASGIGTVITDPKIDLAKQSDISASTERRYAHSPKHSLEGES